ncbi:MAG: hypothetical protein QF477_15125 [SAR202 cluster bacterium]|jgi:hypothetical protein|nr:hypothetical protein [SAR202 cluster bacterium]MDP6801089.1 hypothetical protein [SAR202 cluster bacterium]
MADSERSELPRVMRERKIEPGNENGLVIATTAHVVLWGVSRTLVGSNECSDALFVERVHRFDEGPSRERNLRIHVEVGAEQHFGALGPGILDDCRELAHQLRAKLRAPIVHVHIAMLQIVNQHFVWQMLRVHTPPGRRERLPEVWP